MAQDGMEDPGRAFSRLGAGRFKVREGICLFREGQPGTGAFMIESGRVELMKRIKGTNTVLAVAGPGEIIGEMSLIDGEPRSATAITTVESVVLAIPASQFTAHLGTLDPVTRMILRKMARLVRTGNETLIYRPSIGQRDVRD